MEFLLFMTLPEMVHEKHRIAVSRTTLFLNKVFFSCSISPFRSMLRTKFTVHSSRQGSLNLVLTGTSCKIKPRRFSSNLISRINENSERPLQDFNNLEKFFCRQQENNEKKITENLFYKKILTPKRRFCVMGKQSLSYVAQFLQENN